MCSRSTRITSSIMSEPTATVAALSNALVAHSNANLPPDLSITFDLRRLPAEVREKVLKQAARAGSQEERRHLLAVSSEFYQATALVAWQVSRPPCHPVAATTNECIFTRSSTLRAFPRSNDSNA
jgi:hypothetical protein